MSVAPACARDEHDRGDKDGDSGKQSRRGQVTEARTAVVLPGGLPREQPCQGAKRWVRGRVFARRVRLAGSAGLRTGDRPARRGMDGGPGPDGWRRHLCFKLCGHAVPLTQTSVDKPRSYWRFVQLLSTRRCLSSITLRSTAVPSGRRCT